MAITKRDETNCTTKQNSDAPNGMFDAMNQMTNYIHRVFDSVTYPWIDDNSTDPWGDKWTHPWSKSPRVWPSGTPTEWPWTVDKFTKSPYSLFEVTDTHVIYEYEVPGLSKNNIDIEIAPNNLLLIRNKEGTDRTYTLQHNIDSRADLSKEIDALLENGILTIKFIRKVEKESENRKILVK